MMPDRARITRLAQGPAARWRWMSIARGPVFGTFPHFFVRRKVHRDHLFKARSPAESRGLWDWYNLARVRWRGAEAAARDEDAVRGRPFPSRPRPAMTRGLARACAGAAVQWRQRIGRLGEGPMTGIARRLLIGAIGAAAHAAATRAQSGWRPSETVRVIV